MMGWVFCCKKRQAGFLYADILLAVSLVLLSIPSFLYMMQESNRLIIEAYDRDYAMQALSRHMESVKVHYRMQGDIPPTSLVDTKEYPIERNWMTEDKAGLQLLHYEAMIKDRNGEEHRLATYLFKQADWEGYE